MTETARDIALAILALDEVVTSTRVMECVNPDMTPERYRAELDTWWESRKAERWREK